MRNHYWSRAQQDRNKPPMLGPSRGVAVTVSAEPPIRRHDAPGARGSVSQRSGVAARSEPWGAQRDGGRCRRSVPVGCGPHHLGTRDSDRQTASGAPRWRRQRPSCSWLKGPGSLQGPAGRGHLKEAIPATWQASLRNAVSRVRAWLGARPGSMGRRPCGAADVVRNRRASHFGDRGRSPVPPGSDLRRPVGLRTNRSPGTDGRKGEPSCVPRPGSSAIRHGVALREPGSGCHRLGPKPEGRPAPRSRWRSRRIGSAYLPGKTGGGPRPPRPTPLLDPRRGGPAP
jgi:hypothetical protein